MSTQKTNVDTNNDKKPDISPGKKDEGDEVKTFDSSQAQHIPLGAEVHGTIKQLVDKDGGKVHKKSDSMQRNEGAEAHVDNEQSVDRNGGEVYRKSNSMQPRLALTASEEGENDEVKGEEGTTKVLSGLKEIESNEDEKGNRPSDSLEVSGANKLEHTLVNVLEEPNPGNLSMQKVVSPRPTENLQDTKEERKPRPPPEQKIHQASEEDLRTPFLQKQNDQPKDEPASKCGFLSCLSCLKRDEEPCQWTDFLKCGEQWENKPALKYVRLFCLLLPAVTMIILQVVNSTQDNSLVDTWCLRPRDKNGFGPLFVNIFLYRSWSDAICMILVYVIIASSVMIRGTRVFLISSLWIILAYGLLYWGIALGSECQAGVSTLNLGLAFFNVTQGGLEFLWKMDIDYYALIASLVTFTTYLALLFKKVIPDARSSLWAHLFSSLAGVLVSIAVAWRRRKSTREKDRRDLMA